MSYYTIEGKIHKIFDTEQKSDKFKVRQFVLDTADKYPQIIAFQLTQENCVAIDEHEVGDFISVDFNVKGREWNDKYIINLNAFRIQPVDLEALSQPPETQQVEESLD